MSATIHTPPPADQTLHVLTVRIPRSLARRLKEVAQGEGMSMNHLVTDVVRNFLADVPQRDELRVVQGAGKTS